MAVNSKPTAEDKAMERFTELMIEKIKSINENWEKPWFSEAAMAAPRNLYGRPYNGSNVLMLTLQAEKEGYKLPVWCTFNAVQTTLNAPPKSGDGVQQSTNREEPERVHILKGEKSFPVILSTFVAVHRETKERITLNDMLDLSEEERKQYNVYTNNQVFNVFNVAQTNLEQARPDLYAELAAQCNQGVAKEPGKEFCEPVLDAMISNDAWVCSIIPHPQDSAYYSVKNDNIVVPTKEQFVDGESYYGTVLHEMVHSTGSEQRFNRLTECQFGDKEYAREELVAELGSALICQQNGIQKHLKGDSAAYLKAWLGSLEESPDYIRTVMADVRKATNVVNSRLQDVQYCVDNGLPVLRYDAAKSDPELFRNSAGQPKAATIAAGRETVAAMSVPSNAEESEMKSRGRSR